MSVRCKAMSNASALMHNEAYNKSGAPWAGETSKRKAEEEAARETAKTILPVEGAPKSNSDIEKLHGSAKTKELDKKSQLTVAEDGAILLEMGDEPELLLPEDALHTYAGEFTASKQYDESMKEGGGIPPRSKSIPPPLIPTFFLQTGQNSRSLVHAL